MIVVTRHTALIVLLIEQGLTTIDTPVVSHATVEQIKGQHIIGVLPLHLAAHAASVTEIPLALTPEDRGKELSIERLREIAGTPVTYRVQEMSVAVKHDRNLFSDGVQGCAPDVFTPPLWRCIP